VIVKGDVKDRAVYIILDGIVQVKRDNQATIQLGRGTVLGMDSLVSGAPRSADCVAGGPVKVVQIPPEVFWELLPKLKTAAFEDNLKVEALRMALGLEFFLKDISEYLPQFERRNYRHGDTVTREGEYATHFMVISLGQLAASRQLPNGSSHLMGYLGVRESIGGRALLSSMPHMASVVVHSHTATVLCLPGDSFMAVREMLKRKAVVRPLCHASSALCISLWLLNLLPAVAAPPGSQRRFFG
jgi:CRP-like cAMP-binding protein